MSLLYFPHPPKGETPARRSIWPGLIIEGGIAAILLILLLIVGIVDRIKKG